MGKEKIASSEVVIEQDQIIGSHGSWPARRKGKSMGNSFIGTG